MKIIILVILTLISALCEAQYATVLVPISPTPLVGNIVRKASGNNFETIVPSISIINGLQDSLNARIAWTDTATLHAAIWVTINARVRWADTATLHAAIWTALNARQPLITDMEVGAANYVGWLGRSRIRSGTDGVITLLNNTETGFTTLGFGGTTSSFGALRANGSQLEFKAANNTSFTNMKARDVIANEDLIAINTKASATTADSAAQVNRSTGDIEMRPLPAASGMTHVILASDVTNSDVTANTLADVTGLSFAVISGNTYKFRFYVTYTAAINTTGSRWTITGPTATTISYIQQYNLDGVSFQWASRTSYDAGNLSSGSTTTAGAANIAIVEGVITPSANGTVQLRFASEITASAITAKAGSSYLQWQKIN
jgi:hypothetical protein